MINISEMDTWRNEDNFNYCCRRLLTRIKIIAVTLVILERWKDKENKVVKKNFLTARYISFYDSISYNGKTTNISLLNEVDKRISNWVHLSFHPSASLLTS